MGGLRYFSVRYLCQMHAAARGSRTIWRDSEGGRRREREVLGEGGREGEGRGKPEREGRGGGVRKAEGGRGRDRGTEKEGRRKGKGFTMLDTKSLVLRRQLSSGMCLMGIPDWVEGAAGRALDRLS